MDLRYTRSEVETALNRISWQSWTPTVSANSGTPTFEVQLAKYYELGLAWSGTKGGIGFAHQGTVYFQAIIKILTTGGATGPVRFTLPHTPNDPDDTYGIIGCGREGDIVGYQVKVYYQGGLARIARYDSTSIVAWANNLRFFVQGTYRR